jgi:hypothetical protein
MFDLWPGNKGFAFSHPFLPGVLEKEPELGGGGGAWDRPELGGGLWFEPTERGAGPLWGPMYSPIPGFAPEPEAAPAPPTAAPSYERTIYGGGPMNGFTSAQQARGNIWGQLAGAAVGAAAGLLNERLQTATQRLPVPRPPGTTPIPRMPTWEMPPEVFRPGGTMQGRVVQKGCDCVIEKQMPAYTRRMKGTAVFGPDGQFIGCRPRTRRMNPLNGRAAIRATRRLRAVSRFQRKVERAIAKACRPRGRGGGRGFFGRRKKTCR